MHGGAIGFTSQKGVGSTFAFYVQSRTSSPISSDRPSVHRGPSAVDLSIQTHESSLRNDTYHKEDAPDPLQTGISEKPLSDSDLHILIVEDNLVNQRVLAKQLRNVGMHVAVANHGGEALDYLRTTKYCKGAMTGTELTLILMDWEVSNTPRRRSCTI